MRHAIAQIIAELFGLPDWAPGIVKKVAAWTVVLTALCMPAVFREGLAVWVNQETKHVMNQMGPFLTHLAEATSESAKK